MPSGSHHAFTGSTSALNGTLQIPVHTIQLANLYGVSGDDPLMRRAYSHYYGKVPIDTDCISLPARRRTAQRSFNCKTESANRKQSY
jgi:hypothetical protein